MPVLVTCEHGGNHVPDDLRSRFAGAEAALASHRGWDAGALPLARRLAADLEAPLRFATVSRLVVDLNRSPHHPRVFSEWTRALPPDERRALLNRLHAPHRAAVDTDVTHVLARDGCVLHVGVHTFTPVLDGVERRADVAVLYDPARPRERAAAAAWVAALAAARPDLRVRRNQPYRGAADGLTTWLRRHHGEGYLGLELEVNQRLLGPDGRFPPALESAVASALVEARPSGC